MSVTVRSKQFTPAPAPLSDIQSPFEAPIRALPHELLIKIFGELSAWQAANVSPVCKEWSILFADASLWQFFLGRDFKQPKTENPKEHYRALFLLNRNLSRGVYSTRVIETDRGIICNCIIGHRLILGSSSGYIEIRDLKTGTCAKKLKSRVNILIPTPEGMLISGDFNGLIKIWNLEMGECVMLLNQHQYRTINALCLTKTGKLISGHHNGIIKIWDLEKVICERTIEAQQHGTVKAFCLTKKGHLIAGGSSGKIKVWDLETGLCTKTLKRHQGSIECLILTEDETLISSSMDKTIKFWNLETGLCTKTIKEDEAALFNLVLFESGRKLIGGANDGTIKIWNLDRDACDMSLEGHQCAPRSLRFTKDGELIISSYLKGKTLKILDFTASNQDVFKELADSFDEDEENADTTMTRFSRMPKRERAKIYDELDEILKSSNSAFCGSAESAFHDRDGFNSTPEQKAQAIRHYLQKV